MPALTPLTRRVWHYEGLTQPPPNFESLAQQQQAVLEELTGQRSVRAVACTGSFSAEPELGGHMWAGSRPHILAWQRGIQERQTQQEGDVTLTLFPFETLERWRNWGYAKAEAPLGLLATCRIQYDPTGQLGRIQRHLLELGEPQHREWQQLLLKRAEAQLNSLRTQFQRSPSPYIQIRVLGEVRQIATQQLLPVLLSQQRIWVSELRLQGSPRLPHLWRTLLDLSHPQAAWTLEQLYGFGGPAEAEDVLQAARGLGLEQAMKAARTAVQSGYFDGAVRLIRDEAFTAYQSSLSDWAHYSARKQGKLGTLLGIERAPVGAGALALAEELLTLASA